MTRIDPDLVQLVVPVLGLPFRFEAAHPALLQAVRRVFGHGSTDGEPVARVVLRLNDALEAVPAGYRTVLPHRLEVGLPGGSGWADARTNRAEATVTTALMANRAALDQGIISTLTLFLATRLDRQPLHAGCISWNGRALLLAGLAGTGKSTLAYTAARRGWAVLSDDAVYLQSRPQLKVWTVPPRLHLRPEAAAHFAELENLTRTLRDNGMWKVPVHVAQPTSHVVDDVKLCLLLPTAGAATAAPMDGDSAVAALNAQMLPGFDVFRDSIQPLLHELAARGAWQVGTGPDPRATVALLEQLVQPD